VLWVARPQRPRDGRGQPHPLRHLLAGRDLALPQGPGAQPASLGGQRGAGRARPRASRRACRSSCCTSRARPIEIPDRAKWGMDSHMEAARGAYVLRPFDAGRPPEGRDRRARHLVHGEPRQAAALARGRRPERQDRRRHQPRALPPPAAPSGSSACCPCTSGPSRWSSATRRAGT
jgi:hypothetical protein